MKPFVLERSEYAVGYHVKFYSISRKATFYSEDPEYTLARYGIPVRSEEKTYSFSHLFSLLTNTPVYTGIDHYDTAPYSDTVEFHKKACNQLDIRIDYLDLSYNYPFYMEKTRSSYGTRGVRTTKKILNCTTFFNRNKEIFAIEAVDADSTGQMSRKVQNTDMLVRTQKIVETEYFDHTLFHSVIKYNSKIDVQKDFPYLHFRNGRTRVKKNTRVYDMDFVMAPYMAKINATGEIWYKFKVFRGSVRKKIKDINAFLADCYGFVLDKR